MQIVVISPASADPREVPAMRGLFEAGLERYHVRKPSWSLAELQAWITGLPAAWRPRLVLHQHHGLVDTLGLGGRHERDQGPAEAGSLSRSCHTASALARLMARYAQILFGPVFPSISKAGYGPGADMPWAGLSALLHARKPAGSARVLAVGGITPERLGRCRDLGFDGVALLGAVWSEPDPVEAFGRVRAELTRLGEIRHGP